MDDERLQDGSPEQKSGSRTGDDDRSWAFDISAIFLATLSAIIIYNGFTKFIWEHLFIGLVSAVASVWFLVWPELLRRRSRDIRSLNESLFALRQVMVDVNEVRKEHADTKSAIDKSLTAFSEHADRVMRDISVVVEKIETVGNHQSKLMELRQEAGELSRQVGRWSECSIEFLDFLDHTLGLDDLDPVYRSAVEKIRSRFLKKLETVGIREIRPDAGDEFNDVLHHASGVRETDGQAPGSVVEVEQSGYASGDKVIRPAKVWITRFK